MSSGTTFVRFPDGEVRYGIYHGTAEIADTALFVSIEEAWDHRKNCAHERVPFIKDGVNFGSLPSCAMYEENAGEPVEVWSNYGGAWYWTATATKTNLTSGRDGMETEQHEGTPAWVKEDLDEDRTG